MAMASPDDGFCRSIAEAQVRPKPVCLKRCMGDITLIVAPESADKCFEAFSHSVMEVGNEAERGQMHGGDHRRGTTRHVGNV